VEPTYGKIDWEVELPNNFNAPCNPVAVVPSSGKFIITAVITGDIYRYEVGDSNFTWNTRIKTGVFGLGPQTLSADERVVYGTHNDGYLYSLDVDTGKLLWESSDWYSGNDVISVSPSGESLSNVDCPYCTSLCSHSSRNGSLLWKWSQSIFDIQSMFHVIPFDALGQGIFAQKYKDNFGDTQVLVIKKGVQWYFDISDNHNQLQTRTLLATPSLKTVAILWSNNSYLPTMSVTSFYVLDSQSGARYPTWSVNAYLWAAVTASSGSNDYLITAMVGPKNPSQITIQLAALF
jgi:hypothetical protein